MHEWPGVNHIIAQALYRHCNANTTNPRMLCWYVGASISTGCPLEDILRNWFIVISFLNWLIACGKGYCWNLNHAIWSYLLYGVKLCSLPCLGRSVPCLDPFKKVQCAQDSPASWLPQRNRVESRREEGQRLNVCLMLRWSCLELTTLQLDRKHMCITCALAETATVFCWLFFRT